MRRRDLLIYCGGIGTISGCIGQDTDLDPNETNNSTNNDSESEESTPSYVVTVSSPLDEIEEESNYCQFEDLPAEAQNELKNAITNQGSDPDSSGKFNMSERPTLLDTDCYTTYVKYENKYYFVTIDSLGG